MASSIPIPLNRIVDGFEAQGISRGWETTTSRFTEALKDSLQKHFGENANNIDFSKYYVSMESNPGFFKTPNIVIKNSRTGNAISFHGKEALTTSNDKCFHKEDFRKSYEDRVICSTYDHTLMAALSIAVSGQNAGFPRADIEYQKLTAAAARVHSHLHSY